MIKFISFIVKCAFVAVLCFFVGSCVFSGSDETSENYMDGSETHALYAKNFFSEELQNNMKDPDSYEVVDYTTVYNAERKCYVVDITCRARNSFNGYVVERYMADVTFDGDNVSFNNVVRLS